MAVGELDASSLAAANRQLAAVADAANAQEEEEEEEWTRVREELEVSCSRLRLYFDGEISLGAAQAIHRWGLLFGELFIGED
jgi:hypothetical protein